jgi:hypothetical protein
MTCRIAWGVALSYSVEGLARHQNQLLMTRQSQDIAGLLHARSSRVILLAAARPVLNDLPSQSRRLNFIPEDLVRAISIICVTR